jgi:hypothetical protein
MQFIPHDIPHGELSFIQILVVFSCVEYVTSKDTAEEEIHELEERSKPVPSLA